MTSGPIAVPGPNRHLFQCIYASAATRDFSTAELTALLAQARANNTRLGLTGMLLHAEGNFFQVLEGSAVVVDALYERIEADPRHDRVTMIIREPIHRRAFSDWSMGFCHLSREELAGEIGVNDFFTTGGASDSRARKLLNAFRDGRWRQKLAEARSTAQA